MPHDFSPEQRERIRYWIRRGQAIKVGVHMLKTSPNFELLSPDLIFAAGASYCFDVILHMLDEGQESTATDEHLMTKVHDELAEYDQRIRQVVVSAPPQQDKPS